MVEYAIKHHIPVAAICNATNFMAENGYLGNIKIATVVTNDDYAIEAKDDKYPSYWIKKANEYKELEEL